MIFVSIFSYGKALVTQKRNCISLNNQSCWVRSTFIDLNSIELLYYASMVSLDRCDGSCNTLDYLFNKICIPN